jgi:hypothetical protein
MPAELLVVLRQLKNEAMRQPEVLRNPDSGLRSVTALVRSTLSESQQIRLLPPNYGAPEMSSTAVSVSRRGGPGRQHASCRQCPAA